MAFVFTAVTLDGDIVILSNQDTWQAWCLRSGTLGAILAAWGHLGEPWEQQEGHVGVQNQNLKVAGMILGPHFERLLGPDVLNSMFRRACFLVTFCTEFLFELLTVTGLKSKISH